MRSSRHVAAVCMLAILATASGEEGCDSIAALQTARSLQALQAGAVFDGKVLAGEHAKLEDEGMTPELHAAFKAVVKDADQELLQVLTSLQVEGATLAGFTGTANASQDIATWLTANWGAGLKKESNGIDDQLHHSESLAALDLLPPRSLYLIASLPVACALVAIWVVSRFQPDETQWHDPAAWEVCATQAVAVWLQYLLSIVFTFPLTTAFDMVSSLGFGAAVSGLFIGGHSVLALPSLALAAHLTKPWNQSFSWRLCLSLVAGAGIVHILIAGVVTLSTQLPGSVIMTMLMLLRLGAGAICIVAQVLSSLMAQSVTPKAQMLELQLQMNTLSVMGKVAGPLLSSMLFVALGTRSASSRLRQSGEVVGLLWFAVIPVMWSFVPADVAHLAKGRATKHAQPSSTGAAVAKSGKESDEVPEARRALWMAAMVYECERSISQTALEVAMALILETEFQWDPTNIGFLIAAGFFLSAFVVEGWNIARSKMQWGNQTSLFACSLMAVFCPLLFVPGIGTWLLGSDIPAVMVAEVMMFPSLRITKAILDSEALNASVEGSFYSQANLLYGQKALGLTLRSLTPFLVRSFISGYGRSLYAYGQLVIAMFGTLTVYKATCAASALDMDDEREKGGGQN